MADAANVPITIAEWQTRLLQLDRQNNLLYFKDGKFHEKPPLQIKPLL